MFKKYSVSICLIILAFCIGFLFAPNQTQTQIKKVPVRIAAPTKIETIYIENHATNYISNKTIRNDIPAWEKALNDQFASVWGTEQVKFVLNKPAPKDGITAVFKSKGPIQGALAYHYVPRGVPGIVVYAGTGRYYGYSNSVSFTHEAFELLADRTIHVTNYNTSYPYYWLGGKPYPQDGDASWIQEVCDPVEKYFYTLPGANGKPVEISDWITPNWFNNQVNGDYDFMHLVHQPFTVLNGGYAQFLAANGWNIVQFFRHAGPDASGFYKGEKLGG